jgi:hypothetical protein
MCKKEKPLEDFAWRNKSKKTYQAQCKSCHKEYRRQHYLDNKQKYIDKSAKIRIQNKIKFYEWLSKQECADCGNSDTRVLEFDHVRGKKLGVVSVMIGHVSKKRLLEEIAKCEIVCANCHRIRTAKQFNYMKGSVGSNPNVRFK